MHTLSSSYPRRFPERDLRCSLCQAGLRGHLTRHPCLHIKTESGLSPVTTLTGDGLIPPAFEVLGHNKALGFFRYQERVTLQLLAVSRTTLAAPEVDPLGSQNGKQEISL